MTTTRIKRRRYDFMAVTHSNSALTRSRQRGRNINSETDTPSRPATHMHSDDSGPSELTFRLQVIYRAFTKKWPSWTGA